MQSRSIPRSATIPEMLPRAFEDLVESWVRAVAASNVAPGTLTVYRTETRRFGAFLEERGMPTDPAVISREHVETYVIDCLARLKPSTVVTRYGILRLWFNWLLEEGEIKRSPMERMKAPRIPDDPPPVYSPDDIKALLKACEGTSFIDKRDRAMISLLYDSGVRRGELLGLTEADIDWKRGVIRVLGKGRKHRDAPFGLQAAKDLDRYCRERRRHKDAALPALWLGQSGALGHDGIGHAIKKRAEIAGVSGAFIHRFRHAFAHQMLANGGNEGDLMKLAGWSSRSMIDKYGRSAAAERAVAAHKKLSPRDRL